MIEFIKDPKSAPHLQIVGATGSGKTILFFEKLLREKLKHEFDEIFLFTECYYPNKDTYDKLHLEDEYIKKRMNRVEYALNKGQFDEFLLNSHYKKWFVNQKKDIGAIIRELTPENRKILMNELESDHLPHDPDEFESRRIFKEYDQAILKYIFANKLLHPHERWCLVFDDCSYNTEFTEDKMLRMLLRNGRSRGLYAVVICQKYTDLNTKIRSQFGSTIMFYTGNDIERDSIYRSSGVGDKTVFTKLFFEHFRQLPRYSFAFIKNNEQNEDQKIYFNFDTKPYVFPKSKVLQNQQKIEK